MFYRIWPCFATHASAARMTSYEPITTKRVSPPNLSQLARQLGLYYKRILRFCVY